MPMATGNPPTTAMTTEHDDARSPPARTALAKIRRVGRELRAMIDARRFSNAIEGGIMESLSHGGFSLGVETVTDGPETGVTWGECEENRRRN